MRTIVARSSGRQSPRSPAASLMTDRLDDLAGRVARLGRDARLGPEGFIAEKLTIAAELRRLAKEARP